MASIVAATGGALGGREARAAAGRELARDADDAEAVAAIRRHVDLENRVVEPQVLGHARAFWRVRVEDQETVDVVDELELLRRTQHAVRLHAAQLGRTDGLTVRQLRADAGERRFDAGGNIGRAADDAMLPRAVVDDADGQAVGVRMALDAEDLRHDDVAVDGV